MSNTESDVIIIGAGFAGLIAARELAQAGLSSIILEAKDRIGGRAWSIDFKGVPIELGGGYVNHTQPHMWAEITRYGLNTVERPHYASTNTMRQTRFLLDGKVRGAFLKEESVEIQKAFEEFFQPARTVFPRPYHPYETDEFRKFDHLSSADRIEQMALSPLQRASLMCTAAMQCNNDPHQGGYVEAMRWYALTNFHDETYAASVSRFTLQEGTEHLLNCIASDSNVEVVLNSPVNKIESLDDEVLVTAGRRSYRARGCIVATGLNVWKNIVFAPALTSEKMALATEELSGKGGKIYIEIEGCFQDSRWLAMDEPILSVLPHTISDESSVVVAFTNPQKPMPSITKEKLQAEVAKFDSNCKVLDFKYHDWVSDEFILGTWGNFRPSQFSRYFQVALRSECNVHFASADIALGWRGFFDGAIESGMRAARSLRVNAQTH